MEKWPQSDLTCYLHRQNVCPKNSSPNWKRKERHKGRPLLWRVSPGGPGRVAGTVAFTVLSWTENVFVLPFWNGKAVGASLGTWYTGEDQRARWPAPPTSDPGSLLAHGCPCSVSGQLATWQLCLHCPRTAW